MNNLDKNSISNQNDEDLVVAIVEPKKEEPSVVFKAPTIFSVILATIKDDKEYLNTINKTRTLPKLTNTVLTMFVFLAVIILMLVMNTFVDKLIFIPFALFFCSIAVPFLMLTFYFEFNNYNKVGFFKTTLSFLIGIFVYLVINVVSETYLVRIALSTQQFQIDNFAVPILFTVFVFIFTFLLSSAYKAQTLSDCFLISVAIAMGYAFFENVADCFNSLFVSAQINIKGNAYPIDIIANVEEYLNTSFDQLFENTFFKFVFTPFMYSSFSVIIGFIVSMIANKSFHVTKSIYLLLILVVVLNVILFFDTSIQSLNYILKIISFLIATYLIITIMNTTLNSEEKR